MRLLLTPDSYVDHIRGWLDETNARSLLTRLQEELSFEQHSVSLFGKRVAQPRLIAWCGTQPYTYSGLTLAPKEMPRFLHGILRAVRDVAHAPFNHLLFNLYRNGLDSMGYHADNERELGPDPVIATLSLGATRRFVLKARRGGQTSELEVANGDLVVMGGRCQREFVHGLPKQTRVEGSRLSITFRRVLPELGQRR
jgi:alkylated DNA repair dioxygenase AlkB